MTALRSRVAQSMPRPRHVERHMDDLWAQTAAAMVKAVAGGGRPAGDIPAVEGKMLSRLDRTRLRETQDSCEDCSSCRSGV